MTQPTNEASGTLRVRQVADFLAIGISSVWRLAKIEPTFPKPFRLSPRVTVWSAEELASYVRARQADRDAQRRVA